MCFISKDTYKYTAKKDIVCYKTVSKTKIPFFYRSMHWRKLYYPYMLIRKVKIQPVVNPLKDKKEIEIRIYEGYHSYQLRKHKMQLYKNIKCIIPKGTHYYIDDITKEYVSERIKIR